MNSEIVYKDLSNSSNGRTFKTKNYKSCTNTEM